MYAPWQPWHTMGAELGLHTSPTSSLKLRLQAIADRCAHRRPGILVLNTV